ncbi:MAG: Gfo/Idh/MocA family protein [Pirellulaceae bacterium]
MNNPVLFGQVGYGAWGHCHANAIAQTTGAKLCAIAAHTEASVDKANHDWPEAFTTTDYLKVVNHPDVQIVNIVTPNNLHFEIAHAALTAGKHVLLEKPMTLCVEDCRDLVDLAAANNRILAVGHELRHSSLWGKVRNLIDDGLIGKPMYCLVELSRKPYRHGADGWRFDIDRVGNWILEEPIHFFDLARWYLEPTGHPESVMATANSIQPDHEELQDNFSAIVNFSGGAYAVVTQTLAAFEHHQMVKVTGTTGALWAKWSGAQDRTRHPVFSLTAFDGTTTHQIEIDRITGEVFELEDQMAMMVDAVTNGLPVAADGTDGLWSVAMCVAAQESVTTKQPISIPNWTTRTGV